MTGSTHRRGAALRLAITAVIVALASVGAVTVAFAADSARFEAESMTENAAGIWVVNDANASGGKALKHVDKSRATKTVTLSAPATSFEIRARGTLARGSWPTVKVFVDGTTLGVHDIATRNVDSSTYQTYTFPVNIPAGQHTVHVKGLNDVTSNRALYTDWLAFTHEASGDTTPPDTVIDSGPSGTAAGREASFVFSSDEPGSTFACSLDGAGYGACSSPKSYPGLSDGQHQFSVKAKDGAGNEDATPASRSWTVDATPPETTITSGPAEGSSDANPSFGFSSGEPNSTFACSLDDAVFEACASPKSYSGLAPGAHKFEVKAKDQAGNEDATPATRNVSVPPPRDADGDGVPDAEDKCPGHDDGLDADGDGIPDGCDTAEPPPPSSGPFPGIRWYPTMGVYEQSAAGFVSEPGLIQRQFDDYVGAAHENAYLDLGDGDSERYWFCGGRKYEWADLLVDESRAPASRAEARDPNWSNWKWNQPGGDFIDEMLDASAAVRDDKAKVCLFIATTATAQPDPVPQWVEDDPRGLTWRDGQNKVHIRYDKEGGWQASADALIAITKKYGNDPRVASMTHGEYHTNPDGGNQPADLNYDAFRTNAKDMWREWAEAAPKDANGERVTLVQSQPIVAGGFVTAADLESVGMGVSGSGARIFQNSRMDEVRRALYGRTPLQHQVNAGTVGDPVTFDSTPNPFGISPGQTVNTEYQHIAWYFDSLAEGSKIPLDSLMMGGWSTLIPQWHAAYEKFGPNGTHVARWGQIPNYYPPSG